MISIIDRMNKVIVEEWNKVSTGLKDTKYFRYLLIHGYSNTIIFIFPTDKKFPSFIVKFDRFKRRVIQKEYEILTKLNKEPFIKDTIPQPLGYFCNLEGEFIIQTALRGVNLLHSKLLSRGKTLNNVFRIIIDWLIGLQTQQRDRESFFVDELLISRLYEDLENISREDKKNSDIFSRYSHKLRNLFEQIKGENIPYVLQHGDFWPGNILMDNNKIGIVDWDRATETGFPLCDMLDFSLQCSRLFYSSLFERYQMHIAYIDRYAYNAFFERGIEGLVKKYIDAYCLQLGISSGAAKVIFLWHLITKYKDLNVMELFFLNEAKFLKNK